MELFLNATKPPTLGIVPGSANFTLFGEVEVSVIMPDGSLQMPVVLGLVRAIVGRGNFGAGSMGVVRVAWS